MAVRFGSIVHEAVWFDPQGMAIDGVLIRQLRGGLMDRDELEYRACLLQDHERVDRLRWVELDGSGGVASLLAPLVTD